MKFSFLTSLLLLIIWGSSAPSDDSLTRLSGHYSGTLITHFGEQFTQEFVQVTLDKKGTPKGLPLSGLNGEIVSVLNFDHFKKESFELTTSYFPGSVLLKKVKDDFKELSCFADSNKRVNFCFYRLGVSLEIYDTEKHPTLTLDLNQLNVVQPPPQKTQSTYDLPQAIARAWAFNFDNQIEYEHVMQNKYTHKAAKRNLTPRLSFGSIVGNLPKPDFYTFLSAAGDLLPFLFPTRWLQAKRAGLLSEAEQDGLILLRLDTAAQIESLFYVHEFHKTLVSIYEDILGKMSSVRNGAYIRTKMGQYSSESLILPSIDTAINFTNQDFESINKTQLPEDKTAIAQVLGYFNSQAVTEVTLGFENTPVEKAHPLTLEAAKKEALAQSIELRQLDFFYKSAATNKDIVRFNWFDPTGDPTMNLGAASSSNLKNAESLKIEVLIMKKRMLSQLDHTISDAVTDYNSSIEAYQMAQVGVANLLGQLKTLDQVQKVKGEVDPVFKIGVLQGLLSGEMRLEMARMAFRIARSHIDRLLVQGFYAEGAKPLNIKKFEKEEAMK